MEFLVTCSTFDWQVHRKQGPYLSLDICHPYNPHCLPGRLSNARRAENGSLSKGLAAYLVSTVTSDLEMTDMKHLIHAVVEPLVENFGIRIKPEKETIISGVIVRCVH